jgi:hypothetical protein
MYLSFVIRLAIFGLYLSFQTPSYSQVSSYFIQESPYYQKVLEAYPKNTTELKEALNYYLTYGKRSELLEHTVGQILENPKKVSRESLEKALEVAYAFYPDEFYDKIILLKSHNLSERSKIIVSLYYARKMGSSDLIFDNTPSMQKLKTYLEEKSPSPEPPLLDLFRHSFGENNWVLFSIQTKSREYPGLLLVRKPNGKFLRNDSGSIFHFSQLGRAVTQLPYFLQNGHTPTGIFKLGGKVKSKNPAIGKTPAMVLYMPGEISKQEFFGINGKWEEQDILSVFPESWRLPVILESFEAGHFGRSGIWMHGSTVNPNEFKSENYFPLTPSFGCLTSYEFWDKKSINLYSSQETFWKALEKEKIKGYLIVINRDWNRGIYLEDVLTELIEAEN